MNFDFITNADADPMGFAGPQNSADEFINTGGLGDGDFDIAGLLEDPNIIRALGDMGSIAGKGSFGDVVGSAASQYQRRKAVQKVGETQMNKNQTFQDKMIDALVKGRLLSPTEDNGRADSVTFDGNKGVTIKSKLAEAKPNYADDPRLESINGNGGNNLLDFSKGQSGNINLAGLDPEDVAMLLRSDQGFDKLNLDSVTNVRTQNRRDQRLTDVNKRFNALRSDKAVDAKNRLKELALARQQKLADLKAARKFTTDLEVLKSNLSLERDPLKRELIQAQINNLGASVGKTQAETENLQGKFQQEFDILGQKQFNDLEKLDKMGENELAQITAKAKADLKKIRSGGITPQQQLAMDDRTKDELASIAPVYVDSKGNEVEVPFEERKTNAMQANNRIGNTIYYAIIDPKVQERFGFDFLKGDTEGEINPIQLPRNKKTGEQFTSQHIIDTLKAYPDITETELLERIGAIK